MMAWPENNNVNITSIDQNEDKVKGVSMLGSDEKIIWEQNEDGLKVTMPKEKPLDYAYTLKIEL